MEKNEANSLAAMVGFSRLRRVIELFFFQRTLQYDSKLFVKKACCLFPASGDEESFAWEWSDVAWQKESVGV